MQNLYDVQVVYCMKGDQDNGGRRGRYLSGLRKALADCPGLDFEAREALDAIKRGGTQRFAPELGGSYAVWEERPLSEELVAYAAADVVHLHAMWAAWRHFMGQGNMVGLYTLTPPDP
jgi:exonuclease 3'-5' domain-containing protein 1